MTTLRTGVIGAGMIAQIEHIPNLDQADLLLRFVDVALGAFTVSALSPGHPNHWPPPGRASGRAP